MSLIVIVASFVVSWACVSVRTAFGLVERTRVEERASQGGSRAVTLLRLLDNPPHALVPIAVVNLFALVALASATAWRSLENGPALGLLLTNLGYLGLLWLAGYLLIVYWSASHALGIAESTVPFVAVLSNFSHPLLSLQAWLMQRAKGAPRLTDRVTSDDIQIIVTEGNQERKLEEIEPDEREMIAGIIEMSERTARDLMIPRIDVIALAADATLDEALNVAVKYGHSRLPVYQGDIDHIVGILHVKDLIQAARHPEENAGLGRFLRAVHYVPDTAKADDLLRDLLRTRVHMAVVVDEYGGTVGVVTIEDALEEIVGEIRDEYDAAEEPDFVRISDEVFVFNARVPITEVNDALGIHLPTEESDTLGGLVYSQLGRMPRVGDHVEVGPVDLQVTAVTGRRIKQVRVSKLLPEPSTEPGDVQKEE